MVVGVGRRNKDSLQRAERSLPDGGVGCGLS